MSTLTTEPKLAPQIPPDDPTSLLPKKLARSRSLFDPEIVKRAAEKSVDLWDRRHSRAVPGIWLT
jgi:hypothetical protein